MRQTRMVGENIFRRESGTELAQDRLDRDARAADHGLAAHDLRVHLDAFMGHDVLVSSALISESHRPQQALDNIPIGLYPY